MNRRGFIQTLFQGVVYLPLLPVVALASPARQVIVQQSPIAGFTMPENPWGSVLFEVVLDG